MTERSVLVEPVRVHHGQRLGQGFGAEVVIPGHGEASHEARKDMELTRSYLIYLRKTMGQAAQDMVPFDQAYKDTDWTDWEALPLFKAANRMNAYNTYLLMEHEKP